MSIENNSHPTPYYQQTPAQLYPNSLKPEEMTAIYCDGEHDPKKITSRVIFEALSGAHSVDMAGFDHDIDSPAPEHDC
jgi:hypothetical protein